MYLRGYHKKTLRWLEPFGGWNKLNVKHDHFTTNLANPDTGLCNRILHWEIAEYINTKHNNIFNIFVEAKEWPELALIQLPNTFSDYRMMGLEDALYDDEYERLRFKTVFDLKNNDVRIATRLDNDLLESIFKSGEVHLPDDHYYSDFGYDPLPHKCKLNEDLYEEYNEQIYLRPLTKIRLRHNFIQELLEEGTKDVVGIHMRRFNGVTAKKENLETFKDKKMKDIYKEISVNKIVPENYTFYGDDIYFELIDKMLQINPNQKFYISHDLPDVFLESYITRFGDRIIDRRFFTLPVNSYLHQSGFNLENLRRSGNVTNNIIDLFALSFCPILISNRDSTWSEFATYYHNTDGLKPVMPIDWDMKHIIECYKDALGDTLPPPNFI